MVYLSEVLAYALLATTAIAHPGGNTNREILRRQAHLDHPNRRNVLQCKRDLVATGWVREQHLRRETRLHELRVAAGFAKEKDLVRRDIGEVESSYANSSACTLDPELIEGPYWVKGELVRSDILNGQKGVDMYLDINIIDTSTCEPVSDAYVELWAANATGVYSGVQAQANGDGSTSALTSNALRGIQKTGPKGTVTFKTLVPGHYTGRANHLHTLIHHGAKLLANNTIQGGTISHVGQFFLNQTLLEQVEATYPYNTNQQELVTNADDILYGQAQEGGDDPVLKISFIGHRLEDGLYATIDVGVNPSATQSPSPAYIWTANGSVSAGNTSNFAPSGSAPSGSRPSGTALPALLL